jgi:rubrerythrin
MAFEQYHEPPGELSAKTRTFARMISSLIEEAEAIGWYEQRLALEKDRDARAIMLNAQHEEFKHLGFCSKRATSSSTGTKRKKRPTRPARSGNCLVAVKALSI